MARIQMTELYRRLRAEIENIALIDTHEHLVSEQTRLSQKIDFFYWCAHYASSDLVSAGMPRQMLLRLRDPNRPLGERWNEFAPYWEHVRTTGYGRALLIAARDLFEVDDINGSTFALLSQRITDSNHVDWYDYVLKKRGHIDLSVLDVLEEFDSTPVERIDRRFFAPVLRIDDFVIPRNRSDLDRLQARTGVVIHSFDDLVQAMDAAFDRAVAAKVVGVTVSSRRSARIFPTYTLTCAGYTSSRPGLRDGSFMNG